MAALDDQRRLRAIAATGLHGREPDEAFDRLTRVTMALLDVPVSLVSLVEPERQFFLSCFGLPEPWLTQRETPISHSFCQHCVVSGAPFVVDDARRHPLLENSPAVEDLGVVAYAGVPITTSDGSVIGTLCAIDSNPRAWKDEEISLLSDLAATALSEIERRTLLRELENRGYTSLADSADGARGLNISAVARRTGIPTSTLRKWEERYGVPKPLRTAGQQRRYSEEEIAKVEWLKARLEEGYRIGAAASMLRARGARRSPEQLADAIVDAASAGDAAALRGALANALVGSSVEDAVDEVLVPALQRLPKS